MAGVVGLIVEIQHKQGKKIGVIAAAGHTHLPPEAWAAGTGDITRLSIHADPGTLGRIALYRVSSL